MEGVALRLILRWQFALLISDRSVEVANLLRNLSVVSEAGSSVLRA
jgi:hypothetical protein